MDFNWQYFKEDVRDFISQHKFLLIGLTVVLVIVLLLVKFIFGIYNAADKSYENVKREHGTALTSDPSLKRNMGVMLLGLDKNQGGSSQRADSIMVVMYDSYGNKAKTIRIPRDLYVKTSDYEGKINGLYEKEGVDGMMDEVSDYVGIPITHYVKTDFDGLTNIVDSIGGIDLDSDITIDDSNNKQVGSDVHINKGRVHLNGKEALAYSRIRYIDNDIKRGERQQQVIRAIATKLTQASSIPKLDSNLQDLSPYVKTNIKISDIASRLSGVSGEPRMTPVHFDWKSFDYHKESYVKITKNERERISKELRAAVGLKPIELTSLLTDPTDDKEVEDMKDYENNHG